MSSSSSSAKWQRGRRQAATATTGGGDETELERLFAERTITTTRVTEMVKSIAEVQGALRTAHLRYHLDMVQLLTPEQIRRYSQLRGYVGSAK